MSLIWDVRTVLASEALSTVNQSDPESATTTRTTAELEPIDVWNYLVSLSEDETIKNSDSPDDYVKLTHFKDAHFDHSWDARPVHLGDGASYSVDKVTLSMKRDDGNPIIVAVKKINLFGNSESRSDWSAATRHRSVATVLKELRILAIPSIEEHLNIVSLLGFRSEHASISAQNSTNVSLVMEYGSHGTLRDFCQSHSDDETFDLVAKARFMYDIASGLAKLHSCGIAHGDIKLENTLVFDGNKGQLIAKLSDFGHSILDLYDSEGPQGVYLGTPLMNAPEVRTRRHALHHAQDFFKCDIFSFGLLIWELLLDGKHYFTTLQSAEHADESTDMMAYLCSLSKDELLLQSLKYLQGFSEKNEAPLIQLIIRTLQASLRDDPERRRGIEVILAGFRQHKDLTRDDWMRQGTRSLTLSSLPDQAPGSSSGKVLTTRSAIPRMPRIIQIDFVDQLLRISRDASSLTEKRTALFELAMCYIHGVGMERPDLSKALDLLTESAQLESAKALGLVFRLYDALGVDPPSRLWQIPHQLVRVEKELLGIKGDDNFLKRLRLHERCKQRDTLNRSFDILHEGNPILEGIPLDRVEESLKRLSFRDIRLENLECISQIEEYDSVPTRESLLSVAVRQGIKPLVDFLLPSETSESIKSRMIWTDSLLTIACQGGHLDILELLLSKDVPTRLTESHPETPFHWLSMFEPEQVESAMNLLLSNNNLKEDLKVSVLSPGIEVENCSFLGTALEFAIAANNSPLVDLFIKRTSKSSSNYQLHTIGWTQNTFSLACSLHLHGLIPKLLGPEENYRTTQWTTSSAQSSSLFCLLCPHDALLPLLVHGQMSRVALDSTIDLLIQNGASCAEEDQRGSSILMKALSAAPCRFNTDLLLALIDRGARCTLRGKEALMNAVLRICKREDRAGPAIVKLLLEKGVLSPTIDNLSVALEQGNTAVASVFLDFESDGKRIDAKDPFVAGDASFSLLFLATPSGNASTVELLLDHGADINSKWGERTPLEAAISLEKCDAETIDLLIARGASLVYDSFSLLHRAASLASRVNGHHVLFHLLKNPEIRKLINSTTNFDDENRGITPLNIAVYSGNPDAVHALLQAGALIETGDALDSILRLAVNVGRRPQTSPLWENKTFNEESLYKWRLDMENIIMTLLGKGNPGHGRSSLHIATELNNRPRVIELVERHGYRVFVGDKEKLLPTAYLEDLDSLSGNGDDPEYLENLRLLKEYIEIKLLEEIARDSEKPDFIERMLEDLLVEDDADLSIEDARVTFEKALSKLETERNEIRLSLGDGFETPLEREKELRNSLETQRQRLGATHLTTLKTATTLCDLLALLYRFDEAALLNQEILEGREAQLPSDSPELFESLLDRVCVLAGQAKTQEAHENAQSTHQRAVDKFGITHPVTLKAEAFLACTYSILGQFDLAISMAEGILKAYDNHDLDEDEKFEGYRHSLLELRCNLAVDYCKAQRFNEAAEIARPLPTTLLYVKKREFFRTFDAIINVAANFEFYQRFEDSDAVYRAIIEMCIKTHGKKNAYCTRLALEKLANSYQSRCLWKQESETRQTLVEVLKSASSAGDHDALTQMINLAISLKNVQRFVEESVVLEQVLDGYELCLQPDSMDISRVKVMLCVNLRKQKQLDRAEQYGREALEEYQAHLGQEHDTTVSTQYALASIMLLSHQDKVHDAIQLLQQNLDIVARKFGGVHPETRAATLHLVKAYIKAKRFGEAEEAAHQCLKISGQVPESCKALEQAYHCLGYVKELQDELDEASTFYRASIEIGLDSRDGVHSDDSLYTMRLLAAIHVGNEDFQEAETVLLEILAASPEVYGTTRPDMACRVHHLLGRVYEITDKAQKSVENHSLAVDLAREALGEDTEETLWFMESLISAKVATQSFREALQLAEKLLAHSEEVLGEFHELSLAAKQSLLIIYQKLGMWPESERLHREFLHSFEETGVDSPDEYAFLYRSLSKACTKQGFHSDAEFFLSKFWEWYQNSEPDGEEETIEVLAELARAYARTGNFDAANQFISRMQAISESLFPDDDYDYEDDRDRLCASARADVMFLACQREEAADLKQKYVDLEPTDLDAVLALLDMYETIGEYAKAAKALPLAIGGAWILKTQSSPEVHQVAIAKVATYDSRIHTAIGDFELAQEQATLAVNRASKWDLGNFTYAETYRNALQAMMTLYETLGRDREMEETRLKLMKELRRQEEARDNHLDGLARDRVKVKSLLTGILSVGHP
ncbi:serine/threonine protein kinase [Colletotrichum simmondsii]|uniref:Serine/threonine protein kinase n=1 Tax=Colletotrichum simmondsii TaxID=703756 RepID=A0A135S2R3_9PEZI|nr:serine/threonine protein kinase [Colletotrichum simmondsii]